MTPTEKHESMKEARRERVQRILEVLIDKPQTGLLEVDPTKQPADGWYTAEDVVWRPCERQVQVYVQLAMKLDAALQKALE